MGEDNTPEDAIFITQTSWRTLSLRRIIWPAGYHWHIYNRSKATKAYRDQFVKFFGIEGPCIKSTEPYDCFKAVRDAYNALDTAGILRLQARFGGDYIVRSGTEKPLDLPIAYRNNTYIIYKFP